MSLHYALPSSVRLELEARRLHVVLGPVRLGELAPALILGGLPQAFDLFAFLTAALFVFPLTCFAGQDPAAAIVAGLALCGLPLAAGPVGARLFGHVAERYGHGVRLTVARVLLGVSTAAIAFVPTDGETGLAAALLLLGLCRLAQGIALGGAWTEAPAGEGRARLWVRAATLLAGFILAAVVLAILASSVSRADFIDWGWRYPFVLGIPMNIVALFAQLRLFTTDHRQQGSEAAGLRLVSVREANPPAPGLLGRDGAEP